MARVYSTRFIFGDVTAGETQTYEVPAGFTAVVRNCTAAQFDAGAGNIVAFELFDGGGEGLAYAFMTLPGFLGSDNLETRIVANAGETLSVLAVDTPRVHVTVCGYLLSLP
jgi:hypothetical protein